jgi:dolichol-phosphate hexosyltransferase
MSRQNSISLIIPCRNEAEGIFALVRRAKKVAGEVIVVDNRSTDDTAKMAKLAGARVILENRTDAVGIGYGYALRKGMKAATGEIVVTMDGDGTYPLEQIPEAVRFMKEEGLDFVVCSRFPLIDGQAISWWRQLGVWILNTQVRMLYGYPMQDILSGMWVMDKRVARLLKLKEGGWNLSPEIKLAAISNSLVRVGQYHVRHYEREFGQSKQKLLQTGMDHMTYILKQRMQGVTAWVSGWSVDSVRLNWEWSRIFFK